MSVSITRPRNCHNYAVYRDGRHVDAVVQINGGNEWRLMYNREPFANEERMAIADFVAGLNGRACHTPAPAAKEVMPRSE